MISATIISLPGKKSRTHNKPLSRPDIKRRIVIVGNGMASHRLCDQLLKDQYRDLFHITILAEESLPAYDRVHLTGFLEHKNIDRMLLASKEWYANHHIDLRLSTQVKTINPAARLVITQSGDVFPYDNLVLATGSLPFIPPVTGIHSPHAFVYRTLHDLEKLREALPKQGHVAVLGGGLLGLEAARAMQLLGMRVTIIEGTRHLLSRQISTSAAERVRERIISLGLEVVEHASLSDVERFPTGLRLHFKIGEPIDCDRLIVATGVRPRDELAKTCGLNTSPRGGFVVDSRLRTSKPGIYAIGECAAYDGLPYGLAAPGYRMAECLAGILKGKRRKFKGADVSTTLKVMGVEVHVLGEPLSEGIEYVYQDAGVYRMLVSRQGRILGAISVGPWEESEKIRQAILARRRFSPWRLKRMSRGERLWKLKSSDDPLAWPASAQVCHCNHVPKSIVTQAISAGYTNLEALQQATRAATVCGGCQPVLERLLNPEVKGEFRVGPSLLPIAWIGAILGLLLFVFPSWQFGQSVSDIRHGWEFIWRDGFWHQVTGYVLLGIFSLALILPLRKRIPRLAAWGGLAQWRWVHGCIGCITLAGMQIHTGGNLGHGWNFILALAFGLLNSVGAIAGWALHRAEKTGSSSFAALKKIAVWIHILLFWPLPILIGIHIWSAYAY